MRGSAERRLAKRRLGAMAVAACLLAPLAAHAEVCRPDAIGSRFVEAARWCDAASPSALAKADAPVPAFVPVEVTERETVSVRMVGQQRRLAGAARELRARGGVMPSSALVTAIAHRYRINPRLLASMMHAESAGRPGAVSHKGALGLMQVMPGTARGLGVRDPQAMLHNPVLAVSTGAAYLKQLQRQLGNDVPLVVAAYNAGPGAVIKAGRKVPRYRETQGYVRKVMSGYAAPAR